MVSVALVTITGNNVQGKGVRCLLPANWYVECRADGPSRDECLFRVKVNLLTAARPDNEPVGVLVGQQSGYEGPNERPIDQRWLSNAQGTSGYEPVKTG